MKILVTGGAGFIGSHVVRLLVNKYTDYNIINVDKLTYAGNLSNLKDIENKDTVDGVKKFAYEYLDLMETGSVIFEPEQDSAQD